MVDTGDLAYMDAEGYIRINGRIKDVVIRGGENIPIVEIENLLFRHPAVMSAALVGYPDSRLGERACAFVALRPGHRLDLKDVQAYMAENKVAKQYWPERIEVVADLPKTRLARCRNSNCASWQRRSATSSRERARDRPTARSGLRRYRRGIGLAIAERFGREGARVACVDVSARRLQPTVAELASHGLDVRAFAVDVGRRDDVHAMFHNIENEFAAPVAVLVNNAV